MGNGKTGGKRPGVAKMNDDARKFLGIAPYDGASNVVRGDGYFDTACERKYGVRRWAEAKMQVESEAAAVKAAAEKAAATKRVASATLVEGVQTSTAALVGAAVTMMAEVCKKTVDRCPKCFGEGVVAGTAEQIAKGKITFPCSRCEQARKALKEYEKAVESMSAELGERVLPAGDGVPPAGAPAGDEPSASSLRDDFAGKAMLGAIAYSGLEGNDIENLAAMAYEMAYFMLKERKKRLDAEKVEAPPRLDAAAEKSRAAIAKAGGKAVAK